MEILVKFKKSKKDVIKLFRSSFFLINIFKKRVKGVDENFVIFRNHPLNKECVIDDVNFEKILVELENRDTNKLGFYYDIKFDNDSVEWVLFSTKFEYDLSGTFVIGNFLDKNRRFFYEIIKEYNDICMKYDLYKLKKVRIEKDENLKGIVFLSVDNLSEFVKDLIKEVVEKDKIRYVDKDKLSRDFVNDNFLDLINMVNPYYELLQGSYVFIPKERFYQFLENMINIVIKPIIQEFKSKNELMNDINSKLINYKKQLKYL